MMEVKFENELPIVHDKQYEWIMDLIYYEFPLLCLYQHENKKYLFSWLDYDGVFDRYAILDISENDLSSLLKQEISLLDIFAKSFEIIIFDRNMDILEYKAILNFNQFPIDYLPNKDSFLVDEISTNEAEQLLQTYLSKE